MTATQKCLALTAVALVAVVPPVAAISAFTLPLFGSNNQQVQQVSLDGATFQEETTNGVTSGSCSYKDDRGRTIEVTFTKDRYGRVVARSRSYGVNDPDAAYYTCLHRVEERKRQQLEAAGVYDAGVNRPPTSNAQATAPAQTPTSNAQATAPTQTPTSNAQATAPTQTPTSNAQARAPTQTPTSNTQATTPISRRPSAFPSLSGSTSQSSSSKPGQVQMVFQTSHGNSVQFQENTNGGVTTGQCSYVDWRNRTIKINYTKHPDGRIDVVTDPAVWQPMRAYRTCIEQARQEEERLNQEMAETEADLRRQMEDIQSQMERQEQQAFGRGG